MHHSSPVLSFYLERKLRLLVKCVLWKTPADSAHLGHQYSVKLRPGVGVNYLFNLNMLFFNPFLQFHLAMSLPKSIIVEGNAAEHEFKMRPFKVKTECELSVLI